MKNTIKADAFEILDESEVMKIVGGTNAVINALYFLSGGIVLVGLITFNPFIIFAGSASSIIVSIIDDTYGNK